MNDSPGDRLRDLIKRYLAGEADFAALWDGLFAMLPDLHAEGPDSSVRFADELLTRLMDYDEGDTTVAGFRASLVDLVAPSVASLAH